jgi:hypothetical protein
MSGPGAAAPPWLGYASAALVLAVTLTGIWLLVWSARLANPGGDDDTERSGGPGGRGPETPSPPAPRPDGDPDWWPEFERAFAAYVASRATPAD